MRLFGAVVLVAEAFVIFFATLVARSLSGIASGTVWAVGISASLLCLLLSGLLRRPWAFVAGWLLQAAIIASGVVVTTQYFLGAVFAVLWGLGVFYGRRVDRAKAARPAAHPPE